jgi:mannan endo-1,4-beta-mannosidase
MKKNLCLLMCFLGSLSISYGQHTGGQADKKKEGDGFVKRTGTYFQLNGKPYYYIGANYWQGSLLSNIAFEKGSRQRVQRELTFLANHHVTNLRIVAGAEGSGPIDGSYRVGPSLQPEKGKFSEDAMKGLDYLLAEMGKRNMKAVIYFSNNWDWSGGFLQYLNWNGLLPDSSLLRKMSWDETRDRISQFYSCAPCKADYFRQVKKIISRKNSYSHIPYAGDPTIMAWEMGNEPRPMRPSANAAYQQWVTETAALIKSMDNQHLVTIGVEGQASTDDDIQLYKDIHDDKNIDYLTIHVWPKNWGYFQDTAIAAAMPVIIRKSNAYIEKHEAVALSLDKPLVIEEFGLPRDLESFDPTSSARQRQQYYQTMFTIVRKSILNKGVIAGCNFWAFGGEGKPVKGQAFWKKGDGFLGDPPMEEQGLNAVFGTDTANWKIIRSFTDKAPFTLEN